METLLEKKQRIFNHYYERLKNSTTSDNEIRYAVIEYLCQYPKINPVYMAASLSDRGYKILFDDTSISKVKNEQKKNLVFDYDYRKRVGYQDKMFLEEPKTAQEYKEAQTNAPDMKQFLEVFGAYYKDLDNLCKRLQDEYNNDVKFESDEQDRLALCSVLDAFDEIKEKLNLSLDNDKNTLVEVNNNINKQRLERIANNALGCVYENYCNGSTKEFVEVMAEYGINEDELCSLGWEDVLYEQEQDKDICD